jgi:hypothetical protein
MGENQFSKGEAIRFGWTAMKTNFGFFIGVLMIIIFFQTVEHWLGQTANRRFVIKEDFQQVSDDTQGLYQDLVFNGYITQEGEILEKFRKVTRYEDMELSAPYDAQKEDIHRVMFEVVTQVPSAKIPLYILGFLFWLIGMGIQLGMMKICLKFSKEEKAELGDLFSCYHLLFKYLISSICYFVILLIGILLLIVPGIIFAIKCQFFGYLIVDQDSGPIDALKKSWAMTKGHKWNLFVFSCLVGIINILGLLCLVIGLFASIPATAVAVAYVYYKLRGRSTHQGPEFITANPMS